MSLYLPKREARSDHDREHTLSETARMLETIQNPGREQGTVRIPRPLATQILTLGAGSELCAVSDRFTDHARRQQSREGGAGTRPSSSMMAPRTSDGLGGGPGGGAGPGPGLGPGPGAPPGTTTLATQPASLSVMCLLALSYAQPLALARPGDHTRIWGVQNPP